jgi:flagellar protein FliS
MKLKRSSKMNNSVAISKYSRVKETTQSDEALAYSSVRLALTKLKVNLNILIDGGESKDLSSAFQNSLLAIYFLQKSLDFEKGGTLAQNLFRVYEFCRLKIIGNGFHAGDDLKPCYSFISDISDSWDQIGKN